MNRLTCALFDTYQDAEQAIAVLMSSGIDTSALSVLLHERTHLDQMSASATEAVANAGRGALFGSATGALLGGLILSPLGIIGAGPLAAALLGAGGAGFYGAIAGFLTGRDQHQPVIEALERAIVDGKVLVTVDNPGGELTKQVHAILAKYHPIEVHEL